MIRDNPILGVGIGGEQRATREVAPRERPLAGPVAHDPLTITAKLGILGIVAYVLFLWTTALALFHLGASDRSLALALGALLIVIFVHSLSYSGFFEDPLMWGASGSPRPDGRGMNAGNRRLPSRKASAGRERTRSSNAPEPPVCARSSFSPSQPYFSWP